MGIYNMLTIDNIDKITNCIGYNMWTVVADTHYTFYIDVNGTQLEVCLARHKPKFQDGKPHPQKDYYLLQCHHIMWKYYWVQSEDIKDIWDMTRLIESFINEVK